MMERSTPELIAYDYLRDEIKREDGLTHGRMMVGFTFQGFLVTSLSLLLATPWQDAKSVAPAFARDLAALRIAALGGIGVIGLLVAIGTAMGVFAACLSIRTVRTTWEAQKVALPPALPQAYGQKWAFTFGGWFAPVTALWFVLLWVAYLAVYVLHLAGHYGAAI